MISIETLDNRYFVMSHQRCLQAMSVLVRCCSQRFKLKSQCFIKLSREFMYSTQCLNRSRPIRNRSIVSNCLEQAFGFISPAPIHSESVIVPTYLLRSLQGQAHQYPAYLFKSVQIAHDEGLFCNLNQFIGELD